MSPDELRDVVVAQLPEAPIVVALGGGADSAVAAWVCAGHSQVRAVFVHHGLAGSAELQSTAGEVAKTVDVPLTLLSAPVTTGGNLEARARDARWQAIGEDLADDEIVATGHSQDDVAETVLINLLRGAGSRGLAAMSTARTDIIRPLNAVPRSVLRSLAEELGLPFVDDPANDDQAYLRNRLRADLIPLLEAGYEPGVRATLARAGSLLAVDDAVLEAAASRVPVRDDGDAQLIPAAVLTTVTAPVASRAVRRVLRMIHPPYAGTAADVETVLSIAAGAETAATLSGAVSVAREGPYVAVWAGEAAMPDPVALSVPGSATFGTHLIRARSVESGGLRPFSTVLVDPAVFRAGVIVRAAAVGERIDIADGTKLVRDALGEAGVPVRRRAAWPVLSNDAKIAAIVGGRVARWARPTGADAVSVTQEHA